MAASIAIVSLVLGAGAASFGLYGLPTVFVALAGLGGIAAVVAWWLGIGGGQQLTLDDHLLRIGDEVFPRGELLGVEVSTRDLVLVMRRTAHTQTRHALHFHHAPHELAQLARYLRGWSEIPTLHAGESLPHVRRDASLLERLGSLGATADESGVRLRVQERRVTDMLWVLPIVAAAGLSIAFSMPFLVVLGLALLSFAGFASLWARRGEVAMDDNGLRLAGERLPWSAVRGATTDHEGVLIHLVDGSHRKILLTLRRQLLAEVLTDLARPDEQEVPDEARQLKQLREVE